MKHLDKMKPNDSGGTMKPNKSSDPTTPYGRRQSIIGRVTDSVKDMLSPSWLLDLVNSVQKKPPPLAQDTSSQWQGREIQHSMQTNIQGIVTQAHPHTNDLQNNRPSPPRPMMTPYSSQMEIPVSHEQHISHYSHTAPTPYIYQNMKVPHMNGIDDHSEHSEYSVSTSGCSPLLPNTDRSNYQQEQMLHMNEMRSNSNPRDNLPQQDANQTGESSYLWSSEVNSKVRKRSQPQTPAKRAKPSFDMTSFGNLSSFGNSKLGSGYQESPYYPGKTTFGGASSQRKSRLNSSAPYKMTPTRKEVKAKPSKKNDISGVTSTTAKMILDTLERLSTPINDAKKVPSYKSSQNTPASPFSMSPFTYSKRGATPRRQSQGPPVKQLVTSTPTIPTLNLNRQTPTSTNTSLMSRTESRDVAYQQKKQNQAGESFSKEYIGNADAALGVKAGAGKMKRKKETHHFSTKKDEEEEEVEVPNLPTEVTLSINNMPKFNFGTSPSKSSSSSSNAVSSSSVSASSFSFASPIPKSPTGATLSPVQNQGKFQFSSPTYLDQKQTVGSNLSKPVFSTPKPLANVVDMVNQTKETPKSTLNLKFKSPVEDTSQRVESGFKPAAELKSGSVLDALGKGNKIGFGQGLKPSTELKTGSVLDVIKAGSKSESKEITNLFGKAVNQTDKKDDAVTKGTGKVNDKPLSSLFSKPAGTWNCDVCMVSNKPDLDKCLACASPKPVEKTPPSSQGPGSQKELPSIASMFKAPAGIWSCPTCMIQNKSDLAKCVACETPKPSSAPPPSQPSLVNAFKKPSDSWDCPTCLINNKSEIDKCVACQTAKPGPAKASAGGSKQASGFGSLFTKPKGTWDCPTCLIQNNADKIKCVACETAKPGSSQNSAPTVIPSIFGNIKKKSENNWECETCMVSNKAESSRCVACDYLKPGSNPPATGFTNKTGFKFVASGGFKIDTKPESSSTSSVFKASSLSSAPSSLGSGFKIPGSLDSGTPGPASSGFAFKPPSGSGKPDASKESETKGAFNKPGNETKQYDLLGSKESQKQTAFGGFMAKTNAAKNESEELKVVPSLDSTKSVTSSLKDTPAPLGGFGFQKPKDDNKATPGFSFGKEETKSKPTGGFSFGAKKDDTKTPTPVGSLFGTPKDDTKTSAPVGGFSFGTPKDEAKTVSGGFNFGGSKDKPASVEAPSKGVFSFTANNQTKTEGEKNVAKNVFSSDTAKENPQKIPTTEVIKPFGSGGSFDFKNPIESQTNGMKPSTGGFSFTGKTEPPKTSLAGPGESGVFGVKEGTGKESLFTFGASKPKDGASGVFGKSLGSSKPEVLQQPAMPAVKSNAGGFGSFASLPANNLPSSTSEKPVFGFNKPAETKSTTSSSPFTFGQPVAGANTNKPLGTGPSSGMFGGTAPNSGSGLAFGAKRGISEDEGPNAKKKTGVVEEKQTPFNFGASNTTPGNFSFTGKMAAPATSGNSSVFQFGQKPAQTNDKPLGTGNNNAFGGFGSPSTGPVFGQSQNNNPSKVTPFGGEANKQSPFGTPAQGTVPGFGSSAASSAQPFGSGNMNAGTAPTSGFNFSSAATPNLQFNQTPQANQGGVYKFGSTNTGSNNNANASSAQGMFQFGQTQPAGTNNFSMGGGAPANAFSMQNSAAPSNPFNAVQSGNQSAPRKIRKAVRKLKK